MFSFCTEPRKLCRRSCLLKFFHLVVLGERQSGLDRERPWRRFEIHVAAGKPWPKVWAGGADVYAYAQSLFVNTHLSELMIFCLACIY